MSLGESPRRIINLGLNNFSIPYCFTVAGVLHQPTFFLLFIGKVVGTGNLRRLFSPAYAGNHSFSKAVYQLPPEAKRA